MIVISKALILSPPDEIPLGTPLIGWRNVVTPALVSASSAESDFPAINVANPSTVLKWVAAAAAEQFVTVTFSEVEEVDYVGIARHNFGSAGIPVCIQARYEGVWETISDEVVPANDTPLLFRFERTAPEALRVRMSAGTGAPTMAVLYVGKLLVMERGARIDTPRTPPHMGRVDKVIQGRADSGDHLGTIITGRHTEFSEQFSYLRPDWYRAEFDPFVEVAAERPFFYAWRPIEYPLDVGYAKLSADPKPIEDGSTRRLSVELEMRGLR